MKWVVWNNYRMQKFGKGDNTCGRFVGLRIKYRHLSLERFRDMLKDKTLSPSEIATLLTLRVAH